MKRLLFFVPLLGITVLQAAAEQKRSKPDSPDSRDTEEKLREKEKEIKRLQDHAEELQKHLKIERDMSLQEKERFKIHTDVRENEPLRETATLARDNTIQEQSRSLESRYELMQKEQKQQMLEPYSSHYVYVCECTHADEHGTTSHYTIVYPEKCHGTDTQGTCQSTNRNLYKRTHQEINLQRQEPRNVYYQQCTNMQTANVREVNRTKGERCIKGKEIEGAIRTQFTNVTYV